MLRKILILAASILLILVLGSPVPVSAAGETTITVNSPEDPVGVGSYFVVVIEVNEISDLTNVQFEISFDPDLLSLEGVGDGQLDDESVLPVLYIEKGAGVYQIIGSMGAEKISGGGYLATLTFVSLAAGTSDIDISNGSINGESSADVTWTNNSIIIASDNEQSEDAQVISSEDTETTENEYTVSIQQSDEEQTILVGGNDEEDPSQETTGTTGQGIKWPILGSILGGAAVIIILALMPRMKRGPRGYLD